MTIQQKYLHMIKKKVFKLAQTAVLVSQILLKTPKNEFNQFIQPPYARRGCLIPG